MKRIKIGLNRLSKNIKTYLKKAKEDHIVKEYIKNNVIFNSDLH